MPKPYLLPSKRPTPKPPAPPKAFEKPKRRSVPADVANRVFERDGWKCLCCRSDNVSRLTIDHIVPVSKGGDNSLGNLQTLCLGCNFEKKNEMTAAGMRRLHPELRKGDLRYKSRFSLQPISPDVVWANTVHPVELTIAVRSVLVPVEHHDAVLKYLAGLREEDTRRPTAPPPASGAAGPRTG